MAYSRRQTQDGVTVMNKDLYDNVQDGIDECKTAISNCETRIEDLEGKTLTVQLDLTDDNPDSWATYLDDAASMEVGSSAFDEFFGHYPCLLKNGGIEWTKLNPDNFAEDLEGNSVDLVNGADVMIAFPYRGIKVTKSNGILTVSMTNENNKPGYQYYAHTYNNSACEKFYIGAYKGHVSAAYVLRSLAEKAPANNQTRATFRSYAQARGDGYEIVGFYQLMYLQVMYLLKYKGKNAQEVIGKGYTKSTHSTTINTGGSEAYGMDSEIIRENNPTYMTDEEHHVKLLGLEDLFGNIYEWIDNIVTDANRDILTNPGITTPNDSGTGYIKSVSGVSSNIGNYLSEPQGTNLTGFLAKAVSGSATTYFCDYAYLAASCVAYFGGGWIYAASAGVFRLDVDIAASYASAGVGARLMFLK